MGVYKAKSGAHVALPVNTPKAPSGIKGNVDTIAGTRLQLTTSARRSSAFATAARRRAPGRPNSGCTPGSYPSAAASASGLFPNQILTAYGIAPLQAAGLQGQGVRLAIVGEAPDAGVGRQRVPLLLRDAGNVAEDPQRRADQADPRELARRDGRLDGGAEARRTSICGCTR